MAKAKRKKNNMDWKPVAAGLLILPLVYGTAKGTLPYLQPALERAALWSAGLSFQTQLPEEEARSQTVNQSSIEFLAQHDAGDWNSLPEDPYEELPLKESSPKEPEEGETALPPDPPEEKPANAGTILRKSYQAGTTGIYIPVGKGSLKNCTSLSAAEIQQVIAQKPAFEIQQDLDTPEVLIMHTHATEGYQSRARDWFDPASTSRTTDCSQNTCRVGDEIEKQLLAAGIGVLHDRTLHDYPSYNGAYERSAATVKGYLEQYPSIKVVLDVHRDAIQPDAETMVAPVAEINGKSSAQVMIISGCDNGSFNMPNYRENLKFSAALQRQMAEDYPGLARPILFDYRKYNQDLTTGSILLEMGGHGNTLEEAVYCGKLVGKSLAKVLSSL